MDALLNSTTDDVYIELKRSIVPRDLSSWGGYGLLASSCPSGTDTCGKLNCCPSGYTCASKTDAGFYGGTNALCCPSSEYIPRRKRILESALPGSLWLCAMHELKRVLMPVVKTGDSCENIVGSLPACADNSWQFYATGNTYICCPPETIGTMSASGGFLCLDQKLPIPSSITLSLMSQATGTATRAQSATGTLMTTTKPTLPNSSQTGTTLVTFTPSTTTTPPTVSTSTPNDTPSTPASKSSRVAPTTIVIAVLAGAFALLLIFVIWYFRRKIRAKRALRMANMPVHPVDSDGYAIRPDVVKPTLYDVFGAARARASMASPSPVAGGPATYAYPPQQGYELAGNSIPPPPAGELDGGHSPRPY
ncbi:hypothetical protein P154DRAFT_592857 [Amniculicola lignicola CBS 123094]|uniref:Uncharacterized protein n=1 Tax=Amniculicola lignicola CBS 123094 TaxID=1392246 RepID=A0A6A5X3G2_9PLEO|nr:hypothetical protein P154DRAFT_592857 [Amniculicola lignicola CBS 123094]